VVVNFDQLFRLESADLSFHTEWSSAMQRRRFKNILTFPDRLAKEAERFRQEADTKPPGQERDDLLRKAHQAETTAHMDEWLSSAPGRRR
jgi:hypothetical protein